MAENINRCCFSGNLTRKPDLRETGSGTKVCNMRLAVNSRIKVGGEWQDKANYLDITVFGRSGEACAQYLDKGSPIIVDARADWREWEGNDGVKRQGISFIADNVQFLGSRRDGDTSSSNVTPQSDIPADDFAPAPAAHNAVDDDIPF